MSYFSSAVAHRGDSTPWDAIIDELAAQYGVDPALVRGVIAAESAWDPSAVSYNGSSYGIMQLNIAAHGLTQAFAFNPAAAIGYGTQLLAAQLARLGGDVQLALAAYNAGTSRSAADLAQRIAGDVNGVGTYVRTVLDYLGYYRGVAAMRQAPAEPAPADDLGGGGDGSMGPLDGQGPGGDLVATPEPDSVSWGLLGALVVGIVAVVAVLDR